MNLKLKLPVGYEVSRYSITFSEIDNRQAI